MDLNNLVDKAKDLASNVPEDMKQKQKKLLMSKWINILQKI